MTTFDVGGGEITVKDRGVAFEIIVDERYDGPGSASVWLSDAQADTLRGLLQRWLDERR